MEDKTKIKDIEGRTYKFAIGIIKIVNELPPKTAAFVIGKQIIRSATSINSCIVHAQNSLTRKEFIYYINHAKREAKETKNWLLMLVDAELINLHKVEALLDENEQLIKILVKSVKTLEGKE